MKRRIAYRLISMFGVLLGVGSAFGAGMMMFKSEQKAHQHCPSDTVVWLNTTNATYHFKGERWCGHTNRGAYVCKDRHRRDERPNEITSAICSIPSRADLLRLRA